MSSPISRFHVDRTHEIQLLDHLLAPHTQQRILLLQADTGLGKSLLMAHYQQVVSARGHRLAVIDLRRGNVDAVTLLATLCNQWGWEPFPSFHEALARLATPAAVEVRNNLQLGFNRSQINLPENPGQRQAQIQLLTNAWFADLLPQLDANHPTLILIDTYDLLNSSTRNATVSQELQGWMEDTFLAAVQRAAALRLIVAGQQVPGDGLNVWDSCCLRHSLGPIHNPDDWLAYAQHVGAAVSREILSAFCHTERGHPYTIAAKIDTLRTWRFE